jgi:transposase
MALPSRRLRVVERHRPVQRTESLDQLLPPEHAVRALLAFVEGLELTPLLEAIAALPHRAGAPAYAPQVLVALWLQATLDGVASSRELEDRCRYHLAYRWLCGDDAPSYGTLSAFRVAHEAFLDQLLTQTAATLLHAEVITLTPVAQDGVRVRASAGSGSFRRQPALVDCLLAAEEQVQALKSQAAEDPAAATRRSQAAQQRAATERRGRVQQALATLQQLQATNAAKPPSLQDPPGKLRVSTTDPEARVMKMADGGFRPAYNVQFATTVVGGVIVGVAVTNEGTDANQLPPMLEQIENRLEALPEAVLVDGSYASLDAITTAAAAGVAVYAPLREEQKQLDAGKDPYAPKKGDSEAVKDWRARMATAAAKALYTYRAQTAEWVNAQARNRGWYRVTVRGLVKVRIMALWQALTHNLTRWLKLQPERVGSTAR